MEEEIATRKKYYTNILQIFHHNLTFIFRKISSEKREKNRNLIENRFTYHVL